MHKKIGILLLCLMFSGCAVYQINSAISKYYDVADKVELGDSKEKVLAILMPTQAKLSRSYRKSPEKYIKEDIKVEIYYMRGAHQPDGLTTDDEFVPYLFNNGKLVGIGWEVLGGAKTQGQAPPNVNIQNTNKTIIY